MKTDCTKKLLMFGGFINAAQGAGFPVRIIGKSRTVIASHMPVGYEDETGFHYGTQAGSGFFSIFDSGEQPFFQRGSSPLPPWRLPPESALEFPNNW